MTKLSYDKVSKAIVGTMGVLSVIAARCKVERGTIYDFLEKHPELKAEIESEREKMLDVSESKLFSQINKEAPWAINFHLKTIGKRRGYVARQEIETAGDSAKLEEAKKVNIEIMKILNNHPEAKKDVLKYLTNEDKQVKDILSTQSK